jgi:hypothetical protein
LYILFISANIEVARSAGIEVSPVVVVVVVVVGGGGGGGGGVVVVVKTVSRALMCSLYSQ